MRNVSELTPTPSPSEPSHSCGRLEGDAYFYRLLLGSLLAHVILLTVFRLHPSPADVRPRMLNETMAQRWLPPVIMPANSRVTSASVVQVPSFNSHPAPQALSANSTDGSPESLQNKPQKAAGEPHKPQPRHAEPSATPEAPEVVPEAEVASTANTPTPSSTPPQTPNSPSPTSAMRSQEPETSRSATPSDAKSGGEKSPGKTGESQTTQSDSNTRTRRPGAESSPVEEDPNALRAAYLQELVPNVRGHYFYPQNARRLALEGRVLVALTIDARGEVLDITLHRSSGHRALDDAALTALRRLSRLPPPPPQLLNDGRLRVIVPMNYRLSGAQQ